MKAKIVPTSPKHQVPSASDSDVEAFLRTPSPITKPTIIRFSAGFLVLVVVISFLAGSVGALLIAVGRDQWPWLQRLIGATQTVTTVVTPTSKREPPAEQYADTVSKVQANVVSLYSRRVPLKKNPADLDQLYVPSDYHGAGILLTDDGIGVTTNQVITDLTKEVAVVGRDRVLYTTKDYFADPASDLVFFRISGKGFPAIDFADPASLLVTQRVVGVFLNASSITPQAYVTALANLTAFPVSARSDFLLSSERIVPTYVLQDTASAAGEPVFTLGGKLIGIATSGRSTLLSVDTISSALTRLQATGRVTRNVLGVHYLDLDAAQGLALNRLPAGEHGALLVDGSSGEAAVVAKSPAARAGLRSGDVITKVNEQTLSATVNLTDAIQAASSHDTVSITFRRGDSEQHLPVTLDTTP